MNCTAEDDCNVYKASFCRSCVRNLPLKHMCIVPDKSVTLSHDDSKSAGLTVPDEEDNKGA